MKPHLKLFFVLVSLFVALVIIDLPENLPLRFNLGSLKIDRVINPPYQIKTHLGLDLAGGTHVVLDADMSEIGSGDRTAALDSAKQVIERRVNFFGVSEPVVQTAESNQGYRIIVELPGVGDVDRAVETIGQTARLEFREFSEATKSASPSAIIFPTFANTKAVGLGGQDLKRAAVTFSTQTGEPEVAIEFTPEGAKKFSEVTGKLVGKPLAIFLDDMPVTWPTVQVQITDGNAVITGSYTAESAKILALQLNAGALPVPITVIEKRTIGATMGRESIDTSLQAGVIGLAIVAIFMMAKYGFLGGLSIAALVMYGFITLALYRLIPVTLTLPGIAGFLLSIGMAVDSNILIFERYKEEMREGKPWQVAMELGFGKAWDSIRDANVTTILTALILFNPGNWQWLPSSGLVRGFAATLLIGVLVSLFTGLVVTRTFIRVLYRGKDVQNPKS